MDKNWNSKSRLLKQQNKELKTEEIEFAQNIGEKYVVKRDLDALSQLMNSIISCFGTVDKKINLNAEKIDKALARESVRKLRQWLDQSGRQLDILKQNIPGAVHQCKNNQGLTIVSMSDSFLRKCVRRGGRFRHSFKNSGCI